MLDNNQQSNDIREVYAIKGSSFDTMLIAVRGIQELTMMLYVNFLKEPNQPIFLDKTAKVKEICYYQCNLDKCYIEESKEFDVSFLLKKGKETFIKHDEEIDKMNMEKHSEKAILKEEQKE